MGWRFKVFSGARCTPEICGIPVLSCVRGLLRWLRWRLCAMAHRSCTPSPDSEDLVFCGTGYGDQHPAFAGSAMSGFQMFERPTTPEPLLLFVDLGGPSSQACLRNGNLPQVGSKYVLLEYLASATHFLNDKEKQILQLQNKLETASSALAFSEKTCSIQARRLQEEQYNSWKFSAVFWFMVIMVTGMISSPPT